MANRQLNQAKGAKKDEFYTRLEDVANECGRYRDQLCGKVVLCNADDPFESAFFKYFVSHFNDIGLKKLICTSFASSPIQGKEFPVERGKAYKIEISCMRDFNGDGAENLQDAAWCMRNMEGVCTPLVGDGDFRSPEAEDLAAEADVIITNPPFSLFREYMAQVFRLDKKFLVIGNLSAITYKEIFPRIKGDEVWLGYGFNAGNAYFTVPGESGQEYAKGVYSEETGLVKFRNVLWYTNMDVRKRHVPLVLYKMYTPREYPRYDNYDAINVDRVQDIPQDFPGVMGVPVSFLDRYCPEQFEILGCTESEGKGFSNGLWDPSSKVAQPVVNGRRIYKRIFIRNRHPLDYRQMEAGGAQWERDPWDFLRMSSR
ncbi:MAG: adenine-specific methyltransferase EcoRI family protein [Clostridia bacterium]|nr:adenine-specific methyltransferase EcoRI family protein [Clostridia bacterium]